MRSGGLRTEILLSGTTMDVPPGNEGSDAPQLPSPLSGVAPARHDPGRRRRRRRAGPADGPGLAPVGAPARPSTAATPPTSTSRWPSSSSSCARAGCSTRTTVHPNLWVVAALIFPLIFRRRAPMAVFLVIATVAFVQWLVTGPALADASLLVAMYTVAVESAWVFVAVAVAHPRGRRRHGHRPLDADRQRRQVVRLPHRPRHRRAPGRHRRARAAQPARLAGRARRAPRDRARPAGVAGRRRRARPHRPRDARRRLAQHPGHGDPGRRRRRRARAPTPSAPPTPCTRCRAPGARPSPTCAACSACCARSRRPGSAPGSGSASGSATNGAAAAALAPQPGLGDLDALVERVRGTGLTVSVERAGPALRGLRRRRADASTASCRRP